MLIKLIEMPSKQEIYFSCSQIRAVMSDKTNPLCCQVITNMLTPAGFQSFICLGSAEEVARQVNCGLNGQNPLVH